MGKKDTLSVDRISTFSATPKIISRLGLGAFAVYLGQGITIFGQLAVVPLFLKAWGAQLYGEWLVIFTVVAYISLLDFGMQMYVVNRLNQCYSTRQLNDYTCILHSALTLYIFVAVVAGCLIAIAVFVAPIEQWLNFELMDHATTAVVALLLAIQLISAIPQGLITGLYRTFQEFPRGVMLANFQRTSVFGLTALVLLAGGSVIHVAAIQLIPLVSVIAFVLYDLRKRHPEIKIGFSQSDWKSAITFLGPSLLFFLIQISVAFTLQGSIIVVSTFAGSAYVAIFVIHRTLTNLIRQIIGSLNSVLWPELTTLEAHGDYSRLRVTHRSLVKMAFAVCVFAGIWLHFVGRDIIELWTLGSIPFDQRLLDVFLLYLVFQTPWLCSSVFPAAFNRHRNLAICYILAAILGLGLALILVQYLGIVGVALGLLIADILLCGWFIPLETCRILGDNIRKFWAETVLRGVPVIAIVWGAAWFLSLLNIPPILHILAVGSSTALVGIVLGYFFWLNSQEQRQALSLRASLLNKTGQRGISG
ncbi:MAG: lipopolysaccharide biosynthesis protein [Candidatus Brocadia sp.]|nr:lipopolysaccharide biosynthesis protein [Candidatus Brocadia sp.]